MSVALCSYALLHYTVKYSADWYRLWY